MMRRSVLLALALLPAEAQAHQGLTVGFNSPRGVSDVVEVGDPYEVTWHDGDLGSFRLRLWARPTPPAPYIHAWPLDAMTGKGQDLTGDIEVRDPANTFALDTAALGPGTWFFWFSVTDDRGITEYQPPEGLLTIVRPGESPPPAVWFERPTALYTASITVLGETYDLSYTTRPAQGVKLTLLSSVNDLEGEHLLPVARDLPGGEAVPFTLPLRCVDGVAGLKAVVVDAGGASSTSFATARLSHRPPDRELPEDCPAPEPDPGPAGGGPGPAERGGCDAGRGHAALPALLLVLVTRRGARAPRCAPRPGRAG